MKIAEIPDLEVDPITLDIIENALRHARFEMDAVLFRSAMSPGHPRAARRVPDAHRPAGPDGRRPVRRLHQRDDGRLGPRHLPGRRDPHERPVQVQRVDLATPTTGSCSCRSSSRTSWWGGSSQFGHQMDAGGRLPGSLPTGATTIFEEGIIIPPLKIVERGEVQEDVLRLILNNVRLPEMNRADLFAIVAACHAGERRVIGALRALRQGRLPGDAAGAAGPHARGDAQADPARDPGGAADVRGLDRRRRARQRPVQDEADDLARGGGGLVRLVGHRPAVARADQLLPLRGHVQDVHRGLPDHGQRPRHPVQRRLLSAAARRDAGGLPAESRAIPRRWAAARTGWRGCSTCSAAR